MVVPVRYRRLRGQLAVHSLHQGIDIARERVHAISPERARAKEGCSIMASAVFELFGPWLVR
jgi:hypothetical protein